jgi:hypothetical protein
VGLALLEPGVGHSFAEVAFADEVLFPPADLLIEQTVGLMSANSSLCGRAWFFQSLEKARGGVSNLWKSAPRQPANSFQPSAISAQP